MMYKFNFLTDKRSEGYLKDIVLEMKRLFGILEEEAYGRVNKHWENEELIGDEIMLYHEDEEYWAKTVYYGKDYWWLPNEDIKPIPYS